MPQGAARRVHGPGVWLAQDFPRPRSWVRTLTPPMVEELSAGAAQALRAGTDFDKIAREDHPLPACQRLLDGVYADLETGPGFAVIEGFPVATLHDDTRLIAYAIICAHIGVLVDQSYAGDMKIDVRDTGGTYSKDTRGYLTNAALRFHSDGAAFTGLCCLSTAAVGGASVLASAGAVSNAILERRPNLHEVLVDGFHHHRRGQHATGENPISEMPIAVFGFSDGLLQCTYDRNQSLWAMDEGVVFTAQQIEAMDALDSVLADPCYQLAMDLRAGDIQFVNNFTVLHSRTAYVDGPNQQRHLVRFWLDNPGGNQRGSTVRDLYVREG
ncbi:MAG: TauD/TfdA family dioxygenase [Chromatiales bacterium]|jgi:hypothetical protein|nr:TauD/TfdA family dioxygenase [Chromatiales bacterium]